jgi:hypothetical protein
MKSFLQKLWDLITMSARARRKKEALHRRMTRGTGPYPGRKIEI